ncbi:hypothetical protein [Chamaesiphon minutus]|uniref:Pentapeptide MXKDX repeat protein n=1 Tax=Chamaesiphon minutus (strain ATCC 27169 / PCC 6605) TaxID=1173020 RepID=K9U9S2_CHAP6|nr:hypothetical protein [Chamaesiphon minutus]AFY91348.1 hypothetical protein Cha6605_0040 [Chamaesiphon minutus PCC 6605]
MKLAFFPRVCSIVTGVAIAMAGMTSLQATALDSTTSLSDPGQANASAPKIANNHVKGMKKSAKGMKKPGMRMKKPGMSMKKPGMSMKKSGMGMKKP